MSTESAADLFDRIRFRGQPRAHPDSIVESGQARFTALTPRLLRLEWSETGAVRGPRHLRLPHPPRRPAALHHAHRRRRADPRHRRADPALPPGQRPLQRRQPVHHLRAGRRAPDLDARYARLGQPARHAAHPRRLRRRRRPGDGPALPRRLEPVRRQPLGGL